MWDGMRQLKNLELLLAFNLKKKNSFEMRWSQETFENLYKCSAHQHGINSSNLLYNSWSWFGQRFLTLVFTGSCYRGNSSEVLYVAWDDENHHGHFSSPVFSSECLFVWNLFTSTSFSIVQIRMGFHFVCLVSLFLIPLSLYLHYFFQLSYSVVYQQDNKRNSIKEIPQLDSNYSW